MKNLEAHTDMDKGVCIDRCCTHVRDFSHIIDVIAKALKVLKTSECQPDLRLLNKLDMCKNLVVNTLGRFTALINIMKADRLKHDRDASINTLCNLANSIVEIKNIVTEVLDDHRIAKCNAIKKDFEELALFIDYVGLKIAVLALAILNSVDSIPLELSGKVASSLASLIFSSFLNIHNNEIKRVLKDCTEILSSTLTFTNQ